MKRFIAGAALTAMLVGTAGGAVLAEDVVVTTQAQTQGAQSGTDTTAAATTGTTATTDTAATTGTAATTTSTTTATGTVDTGSTTSPLPEVSVTPDTLFYSMKLFVEQVRLVITRDAAAKAALLEEQASTRMAEAKAMAEAGKADLAAAALGQAMDKLAEAQKYMEAAAAAGKQMDQLTAQLEADQVAFAQAVAAIQTQATPEAMQKMQAVLADLLVQVSAARDAAAGDTKAAAEAQKLSDKAKLKENLPPRVLLVLGAMAKASDKSLADVVAMYKVNPGLGLLAQQLGLKMGAVQHAAKLEWKLESKRGEIKLESKSGDAKIEIEVEDGEVKIEAEGLTVPQAGAVQSLLAPDAEVKFEIKVKGEHGKSQGKSQGKGHDKEKSKEHGKGHEADHDND